MSGLDFVMVTIFVTVLMIKRCVVYVVGILQCISRYVQSDTEQRYFEKKTKIKSIGIVNVTSINIDTRTKSYLKRFDDFIIYSNPIC